MRLKRFHAYDLIYYRTELTHSCLATLHCSNVISHAVVIIKHLLRAVECQINILLLFLLLNETSSFTNYMYLFVINQHVSRLYNDNNKLFYNLELISDCAR